MPSFFRQPGCFFRAVQAPLRVRLPHGPCEMSYRASIGDAVVITLCKEEPGQPIAGSRYVRWYCPRCGDGMRVSRRNCPPLEYGELCETCFGRHDLPIGAGTRHEIKDDMDPWQENAIRAMEGD